MDCVAFGLDDDELKLMLIQRGLPPFGKLRYQPIGFEPLPKKFTLSQLQHLYELILERELDKRNCLKRVLAMDLLIETDEVEQDVAQRASRLYRSDEREYRRPVKAGFKFEL